MPSITLVILQNGDLINSDAAERLLNGREQTAKCQPDGASFTSIGNSNFL